jgi:hypothetical protein
MGTDERKRGPCGVLVHRSIIYVSKQPPIPLALVDPGSQAEPCGILSPSLSWPFLDEAAGYVLMCSAYPRSNVRVRTHQKAALRDHRKAHGRPAPEG